LNLSEFRKNKVYCLTSSYATKNTTNHVVHVENKGLVKGGFVVKTITHHVPKTPTSEIIDSVIIKRYKYLPEKFEFNTSALADEINKSKINKLKGILLFLKFAFFTYFECLKDKPDIILAHFALPPGIIANIISKLTKTKYLVAIHGTDIAQLKKNSFFKKLAIHAMNNASMVIANGNFSKNELIKLGVNEKIIQVIYGPPNYVDHTNNQELLEDFRSKFVKPNTKIILFVGRLIEVKGVEYLIRAIKELKSHEVHLIIAGEGSLRQKLQSLTNSLDLENDVTFFGHASREKLGLLYDISDISVCPSIIDSHGTVDAMPLVIPEAMESGLPVIASAVGGIVEMIKHEENGLLVRPEDPKSIASAIARILQDERLKNKIIEKSKELVKERSIENTEKKYVETITKILYDQNN